MTKASAVEQFIEAINESPQLAREARAALDGSKGPRAFVELGAEHGYKFTQAQAQAYFRDIAEAPPSDLLSEIELRKVLGAKVDQEPAPRDRQLKSALTMLREMNFERPPRWTVFAFKPAGTRPGR